MSKVDGMKQPPRGEHEALAERLASEVQRHRALYYAGSPEISDAEFDALEDRLRELAPEHPVLAEVGASTAGGRVLEPSRIHEAVVHHVPEEVQALARTMIEQNEAFHMGPVALEDAEDQRAYRSLMRTYRATFERLEALAPDHVALTRVVPPEGHDWPKARHELPMGSLNKVNSKDELHAWCERCDALAEGLSLPLTSRDLSVTEKLDGLSLEILYDGGVLEAAITRGDGEIGELITANVLFMQGVPARIPSTARLSVRGEIVLLKADAPKVEAMKMRLDKDFKRLKSLRNTAAGLARAKEPKYLHACAHLTVLFYDLEGAEGLATERDKLGRLEALGFGIPRTSFGNEATVVQVFDEYASSQRQTLDYEIDGLVVRANDLRAATLLGELNNRPRAAVAFKFSSEMQVTTLLDIVWSTGDTGRITPIAQIEPVFLAGAEVRQASLHNVANVRRLGLGRGDEVLVSRRNDVIPYVEKLVAKLGEIEDAPSACARCNTPVTIEGEYLVCRNDACPARKVGRLKTWIRELGLLDWGEKTLERLFEAGLVTEPADLYRLKTESLVQLSRFGDQSARNLLEPLGEKKQLPLGTFIAALGIEGVSRETAKLLVSAGYDAIDKIASATIEALSSIAGLGSIKAERILSGIRARIPEIERLAEVGVLPVKPEEGGPLSGLSFCFSGKHNRPRKELENIVTKNGGSLLSGVTKGLSYLVLADPASTSSKAEKARKLGTQVIDESALLELVVTHGGAP